MDRKNTRFGNELRRLSIALMLTAMAPVLNAAVVFGPGADWVSGVTPASHDVSMVASLVLTDPSGTSELIALSGPGSVANGAAQPQPSGTGNDEFEIEIVAMSLHGVSPIYGSSKLTRAVQSAGFVLEPISNATLADGFFDTFLEFEIAGVLLHSATPARLAAGDVAMWPAIGTVFGSTGQINWLDENGQVTGLTTPRLTLTMTGVVPVPPALLLFASGLFGFGVRRRCASAV